MGKKTYCDAVRAMPPESLHHNYHDHQYGFPLDSDDELFGRLILEMNQAGLSWTTILKKQDNFRTAYSNFNIQAIAAYSNADVERLLGNAGIIRNRRKVEAAINNAKCVQALQKSKGSFQNWLDSNHPLPKEDWVKLFKKTFKFTGGEITNEFLVSTGYLPGAHDENCPIYHHILELKPAWLTTTRIV